MFGFFRKKNTDKIDKSDEILRSEGGSFTYVKGVRSNLKNVYEGYSPFTEEDISNIKKQIEPYVGRVLFGMEQMEIKKLYFQPSDEDSPQSLLNNYMDIERCMYFISYDGDTPKRISLMFEDKSMNTEITPENPEFQELLERIKK